MNTASIREEVKNLAQRLLHERDQFGMSNNETFCRFLAEFPHAGRTVVENELIREMSCRTWEQGSFPTDLLHDIISIFNTDVDRFFFRTYRWGTLLGTQEFDNGESLGGLCWIYPKRGRFGKAK